MNDTIIIEIDTVNTCLGVMARFWKGESCLEQVGLKKVVNAMNDITARYNNTEGKAVLFSTKGGGRHI